MGKHGPVCGDVVLNQLLYRERVSQRTAGTRSNIRKEIRFHSFFSSMIECLLKNLVTIFAIRNIYNLRSEQLIEQQICRSLFRHLASQNKNTFKSKSSCCRCGLTAMIGLQRPASDQGLRALVTRFRYAKFQFSILVPAQTYSALTSPLDHQP